MNRLPDVSVVMSVYNNAATLHTTIESILSQDGVSLEFIIVNDGSTDGGGAILDEYAKNDPRLRILHQENQGLTRALINGCAIARGEYIARQDAGGDVSLPGRLRQQLTHLSQHPNAVLSSCGTRYVGPAGETLYNVIRDGPELDRYLKDVNPKHVVGVSHHGSVVMHRAAYLLAGGYRSQFKVAQDLDLWLRLSEVGECLGLPELLYEAVISFRSVSHIYRDQQIDASKIIVACALARRSGNDETKFLAGWIPQDVAPSRVLDAKFYYFLARVLQKKDIRQSLNYFWHAARTLLGAYRGRSL
jgi:glycosyltransferase involved in cell wall biosynthesis